VIRDIADQLIHTNTIITNYFNADVKQIQPIYYYEKTVLNVYLEVANQLKNFITWN